MLRALIACLAIAVSLAAFAAPADSKWRLQFSGDAESGGTVVIAVTPVDGEATSVTIEIAKGTSENGVARRVRDGLKASIGAQYSVERDDGEDVLIKRRRGERRFNVTIVSNSVRGVRINPDQE